MGALEPMVLLLAHLVVPALLIAALVRSAERGRRRWIVDLLVAASYICLLTIAGAWPSFGYPVRYIFPVLLIVVAIGTMPRALRMPRYSSPAGDVLRFSVAALLLGTSAWVLAGSQYARRHAVQLSFPLRGGIYTVAQGGANMLLNAHAGIPSQHFGMDIVKLHWFGFRAAGLQPRALDRYAIYGDPVVSPCSGRVLAVRDDLPDLIPPVAGADASAGGNEIILDCGGLTVVLSHLRRGSIRVATNQRVRIGDRLASVGNSGRSAEPHLHVHALSRGRSVPIRFDRRSLVRNSLFVSR